MVEAHFRALGENDDPRSCPAEIELGTEEPCDFSPVEFGRKVGLAEPGIHEIGSCSDFDSCLDWDLPEAERVSARRKS